jgi:cytochrome c oxidase cbb3-type subunit I/II
MRAVGVPYDDHAIETAAEDARAQALEVTTDLRTAGVDVRPDVEMVALIAYLQRLGAAPAPSPDAPATRISMSP